MKKYNGKLLLMITILFNLMYILWRIFFTIPKGQGYFSLICAITLLVVEIMGMFEMFVHYRDMSNIEYPQKPEIDQDLYPDVDVFVTTYNESVELVQKTINGCVNMEYPDQEKVHIYICDDSNRKEMQEMAVKMGVNYITREEREGAKAGNLNNAMEHSKSPLIATFDADMIPMHDFLMATVPYFLKKEQVRKDGSDEKYEKIGFVQTPQSFYNLDLFQFNLYSESRIPNEQDYFYRDIQLSRNKTNSVIYGGSNTVILREALEEVGGFYTRSITEDFATGILIQSKGYICYAIPEVHASGLSPTDLKSLVKQRERWARGCIQTGRRLNILFRRGLRFSQRISYLTSISYWYASIKRFIFIMAPILFSVFNVTVVDCDLLGVLIFWLPMYIFSSMSLKLFSKSIRNVRWTNIYETILFQPLMISVILETLAISKNKFAVTEKDKVEDEFKYKFIKMLPYYIYIALSVVGTVRMIVQTFKTNSIVYVVPLFWIINNLSTLVMAVMFMHGRKQFRRTERFNVSIDCNIKQNNYEINTKTMDISEGGFAFVLDNPEYISPKEEFNVIFNEKIGEKKYNAKLKAKIVNVTEMDSKWKYSAYITEIKEEQKRQWLQIIHDRIPTLPRTIDRSMGLFDDLQINIKRRIRKARNLSRRTPRINLSYEINTKDNLKVSLENFNYQYVLLKFQENNRLPNNVELDIENKITLDCMICEGKVSDRGVLYKVNNIDEILGYEGNRNLINKWLITKGKFLDKYKTKNLKVADDLEFEPMKHI